jgi:hypothetical protein
LNGERQRGAPPPVDTEPSVLGEPPPPHDAIADGAMYPAAEVRRLVAQAEGRGMERGRNSAWAESRRTFQAARDELVARHEAALAELRAQLTVEVAQATRDAVLAALKGR